jgi:hypothetical protein
VLKTWLLNVTEVLASESKQIRLINLWSEVTGGEDENRSACDMHERPQKSLEGKRKKR